MPEFVLLAEDGCVPLDVLAFMAEALDLQMRRDVAPIYGGEPWTVSAMSSLDGVRDSSPGIRKVLTFRKRLDVAGALGYHTEVLGVEYAQALVPSFDDTRIDGTTASHEVIETFCDPGCNKSRPWSSGNLVDYETADPVEADSYDMKISIGSQQRLVAVSNFVTPLWFGEPPGATRQYDFLSRLRGPFEMSPGGYFRLVDRSGAEHYIFADESARLRLQEKLANNTSRVRRRSKGR